MTDIAAILAYYRSLSEALDIVLDYLGEGE